jgi:hypothetical protein
LAADGAHAFTLGSFEPRLNLDGRGACKARLAMKTPLLIVLAVVVLGTGSALAVMNNVCKSSRHAWCAPASDIRHYVRTGRS